ncbi:hypothetical protein [Nocardia huaxiensis]|uniref:Transmembrane protein n=1 Tax=Nocardia huaxiensis TaxID=2755382 RepID=A0A7D6VEF2_9NOCA|nr:hypothetical protein [Nocardia huaxiensis]QLY30937.1 hypothetical protein H0264_00555 [Nocardia huaxiensis]UFS94452.1 hypothetical protein LPY97_27355 [Nocardia huaxiensis]
MEPFGAENRSSAGSFGGTSVLTEDDVETAKRPLSVPEGSEAGSGVAVGAGPLRKRNVLIAVAVYAADVVAAFVLGYLVLGKLSGLIHNRCTAKRDFSVQCDVIRPPTSGLLGLLIAGGGISLALVAALVLASVAAVTRRNAWLWTAVAFPVIVVAGLAGYFLVNGAVS